MGRKDNLFVSGGENISPEEIERALCAVPEIVEAIVIPIHDGEFGARPVAFVRGTFIPTDIYTQLADVLPRFKIPRLLNWPDEIPSTGIKVSRRYFARLARALV